MQKLLSLTLLCSDLSVQTHSECFTPLLLTVLPDIFRATFSNKNRTDKCTYRNRSLIVPLCKPTRHTSGYVIKSPAGNLREQWCGHKEISSILFLKPQTLHRLPLHPLKNAMLVLIFVPLHQETLNANYKIAWEAIEFSAEKIKNRCIDKASIKNSLNFNRTWILKALTDFSKYFWK